MSIVLGLETSTQSGSIALQADGTLLEARTLSQTGRRHAQSLVSEIKDLFETNNISSKECDKVAVSIGPGSFTGLRVGIVFAKLMAYASGCQVIPVDTLKAIAENSPKEIENVSVITNAQRGDLFLGRYKRNENGIFESTEKIEIVSGKEWVATLTQEDRISGNGIQIIQDFLPSGGISLHEKYWLPGAETVARLGDLETSSLTKNEVFELEPFYLRKSAAEEKKDNLNT